MNTVSPLPGGGQASGATRHAQVATNALASFFAAYLCVTRAVEIAEVKLHLTGAVLVVAMLAPAGAVGMFVVVTFKSSSRAWTPFLPPASTAVLYADHVSGVMAASVVVVAIIAGLVAAWWVVDRRIADVERR